MKRNTWMIASMLCAGLFFAKTAFCETIQGVITYLDASNQMIGIRETNSLQKTPHQHVFLVDKDLETEDLETGQIVNIDAKKSQPEGILIQAASIEVTGNALSPSKAAAVSA